MLVVGGGSVALRKVQGLLQHEAAVTVVARDAVPAMVALAEAGDVDLQPRLYQTGEAKRFALVFAATDDRDINRLVSSDAQQAHVLVNVADDPELCTFHLPARIRRGALQIALFSDGSAPFVTRRLRQCLERRFGEPWTTWMDAAKRFRLRVKGLHLSWEQQEALFDAFFAATVDGAALTTRLPTAAEEAAWLGSVQK